MVHRRARSEVPVRKWQRARNEAFAVALTLPAGAPEAEAVVAAGGAISAFLLRARPTGGARRRPRGPSARGHSVLRAQCEQIFDLWKSGASACRGRHRHPGRYRRRKRASCRMTGRLVSASVLALAVSLLITEARWASTLPSRSPGREGAALNDLHAGDLGHSDAGGAEVTVDVKDAGDGSSPPS